MSATIVDIFYMFVFVTVAVLGAIAIYKLLNQTPIKNHSIKIFASLIIFCILIYCGFNLIPRNHYWKKWIIKATEAKYDIRYDEIKVVEGGPKAGFLAFGHKSAAAFRLDSPITIKMENSCNHSDLPFYFDSLEIFTRSFDPIQADEWNCEVLSRGEGHRYVLAKDNQRDIYYFQYVWSAP